MSLIVANDAPLPAEYKDHMLSGDWDDHRECRTGGDLLLVYTVDKNTNLVVFVASGTHAELFE